MLLMIRHLLGLKRGLDRQLGRKNIQEYAELTVSSCQKKH